jgi:hypothetical protein
MTLQGWAIASNNEQQVGTGPCSLFDPCLTGWCHTYLGLRAIADAQVSVQCCGGAGYFARFRELAQ